MSTRFTLVRHAVTPWNAQRRIQGQSDIPLAPEGIAQATAWAAALSGLDATLIVSSDLRRAVQTARILNEPHGLPVRPDERLREQDWGTWVGLTACDIDRDHAAELAAQAELGWDFRPPGGESRREVLARSLAALADAAVAAPDGHVLVVAHLGVVKCLLYHLLDCDFLPGQTPFVASRALHRLRLESARLSIETMNEALP